jgi:hypothetical protein
MDLRKAGLWISLSAGLAGYSLLIVLDFILCQLLFLKKNVIFTGYNFLNGRLLLRIFGKDRIHAFNNLEVADRAQSFRQAPGALFDVTVRLRNTSPRMIVIPPRYQSLLGPEGPLRVGTSNPRDRDSALYWEGWEGRNRLLSFGGIVLGPGESIPLTCTMKSPARPGAYQESFGLVYEGFMWLNDQCVFQVGVEVA